MNVDNFTSMFTQHLLDRFNPPQTLRTPGPAGVLNFGGAVVAEPDPLNGSPWNDPALSAMLGYAANAKDSASGQNNARQATAPSPWSIWAEAGYTPFAQYGQAATKGGLGLSMAAVEYQSPNSVLVGVAVAYENQRFNTSYNGGFFRASGAIVGPYAAVQLTPNILAHVWAGTGFLNYSASDGIGAGSFKAQRYFVLGTIAGMWQFDHWRFSPRAGVLYLSERQDGFTDTTGLLIPGATVTTAKILVGPEIGYLVALPASPVILEPYGYLALECNLVGRNSYSLANGAVVADQACNGRVGPGLKIYGEAGLSGGVSATYNSLGVANQNAWTIQGRVTKEF